LLFFFFYDRQARSIFIIRVFDRRRTQNEQGIEYI